VPNTDSAIARCKKIRDRLYPRESRPTSRYTREVLNASSTSAALVDVGCGRKASWLRRVAHAFGTCYGIDLEIVRDEQFANCYLIHGSAGCIPLADSTADVVTMCNVVEHLTSPQDVFLECLRILRPGGRIILLTPNSFFPPLFAARLLPHRARQAVAYVINATPEEDVFPAYYRANTVRQLQRISQDVGLSVVRLELLSQHPEYFMFSETAYRLWAAVERMLLRRKCLAGLRHYILAHFRAIG